METVSAWKFSFGVETSKIAEFLKEIKETCVVPAVSFGMEPCILRGFGVETTKSAEFLKEIKETCSLVVSAWKLVPAWKSVFPPNIGGSLYVAF